MESLARSIDGGAGGREINGVPLEEKDSNEKSPAGDGRPLYSSPKGQVSYSPWLWAMTNTMGYDKYRHAMTS